MKAGLIATAFCLILLSARAQKGSTELYELLKGFMYDSTGYENVGEWAVDNPSKFPVSWESDGIIMSQDTSINFYRKGTSRVRINGKSISGDGKPEPWKIMLKGARMGYSSFSILSPATAQLSPGPTLEQILGNRTFTSRLIKKCDLKDLTGYYYYEVKFPHKDPEFIKLSWITLNGKTAIRIDGYDSYSRYAAKLDCKN